MPSIDGRDFDLYEGNSSTANGTVKTYTKGTHYTADVERYFILESSFQQEYGGANQRTTMEFRDNGAITGKYGYTISEIKDGNANAVHGVSGWSGLYTPTGNLSFTNDNQSVFTTSYRNIQFAALDVSDLTEDTDYWTSTVDTTVETITTSYVEKATLTFNVIAGEPYVIFLNYAFWVLNSHGSFDVQLEKDGTTQIFHTSEAGGSFTDNGRANRMTPFIWVPDTTEEVTLSMQVKGSSTSIQKRHCAFDVFPAFNLGPRYELAEVASATPAASRAETDTGLSVTMSGNSTDVLIIANGYAPNRSVDTLRTIYATDGAYSDAGVESANENTSRQKNYVANLDPFMHYIHVWDGATNPETISAAFADDDTSDWTNLKLLVVELGTAAGPPSGGSTTIRGDVSPQYIADLASAAGVTLTRGSVLGQLNEIAGRTWPDYLEFEAAKEAAETAAGFT